VKLQGKWLLWVDAQIGIPSPTGEEGKTNLSRYPFPLPLGEEMGDY